MHELHRNQRIAAARAFKESLDQLQDILAQERPPGKPERSPRQGGGDSALQGSLDLKLLEEVAADLDAFFGDTPPGTGGEGETR